MEKILVFERSVHKSHIIVGISLFLSMDMNQTMQMEEVDLACYGSKNPYECVLQTSDTALEIALSPLVDEWKSKCGKTTKTTTQLVILLPTGFHYASLLHCLVINN